MEETTYLNRNGVLVTSTRIELDGQTFAVRNIGAAMLPAGKNGGTGVMIFGLLLIGGAGAWLWQRLTERTLVLVTGGGEVAAYKSRDPEAIEAIRAAVASAISTR